MHGLASNKSFKKVQDNLYILQLGGSHIETVYISQVIKASGTVLF